MRATRSESEDQLLASARKRVETLMRDGVTTLEIKSGYGLDTRQRDEVAAGRAPLGEVLPLSVVTTFLGAHALPPEAKGDKDAYIADVCDRQMPAIAKAGLADAVDAFCESIAFSPEQTARVFETARKLGLPVKLHAEQLTTLGGAELAARFGALSADHLEHADEAGIAGVGAGRHRGRAAARRLLFPARDAEAAGRSAAQARRADRHLQRFQSRHLAADLAAADHEHGARPSSA